MGEWAINLGLFTLILASGVFAPQFPVSLAYLRCAECGNLNAKRRTNCRMFGNKL